MITLATNIAEEGLCKLGSLAKVQPGYLNRSRVHFEPDGTHRILQAGDISPEGNIRIESAIRFFPRRKPDIYRVSAGDILFFARGQNHTAHLVGDIGPNVLASNVFYIIRPRKEIVNSGYLAWYLNQSATQAKIRLNSQGTGIPYVSRQIIEELDIPVLPLEQQQAIATILTLRKRKKALQSLLDTKHDQLIHAICRQAIAQEKE